jgi:hypothetical protein
VEPENPWRDLPLIECPISADPRLVRELLAGAISQPGGESAGHRFRRLERVSDTEAVVRFEGRILGIRFVTVERLRSDDVGVTFELVSGYLPAVQERMEVLQADGGSVVRYSGRYRSRPGLFGRLLGPILVPLIYGREAAGSLRATKTAAEARQAKSALYRREAG